jgi:hypothetical protein
LAAAIVGYLLRLDHSLLLYHSRAAMALAAELPWLQRITAALYLSRVASQWVGRLRVTAWARI